MTFAGFYVPGKVQILIGSPLGQFAVPVEIPGLPSGVQFPFVMSGRAADEFATADQTTDSVTLEVGADGEVIAVVSFDRTGTLTINVMKSSGLNIALSKAHNAMVNPIAPLLFTIPVTYVDPFAVDKGAVASNCVIQRAPPMSFGATEGENSWQLLSAELLINHGARVF